MLGNPQLWRRVVVAILVCFAGALGPIATAAPPAQTWTPPTNVSTSQTQPSTKPAMASDNQGTLHAVWVEGTPPNSRIMWAAKPPGQPWSGGIPVSEQQNADNPRIFVDSQNNANIVWQADGMSNKPDIYFRQIRNNLPQPFQQVTNTTTSSTSPDIAVDVTGRIHIVFLDDASGVNSPFYITKLLTDPIPALVSVGASPSLPALLPRVAVDSQNTAHVIWGQPPGAGLQNNIFYAYKPATQATFSPNPPMNATNATSNSTAPVLAVDAGDTLHLVWLQTTTGRNEVYYSRKGRDEFTWRAPLNASQNPNDAQTPSMTVDARRSVHVAFAINLGAGNTNLFYAEKDDTGTAFTIPQPVFTTPTTSTYPAIAATTTQAVNLIWQQGPAPEKIFHSGYILPQPAPASVLIQQIEADSPSLTDSPSYQWVQLTNNGTADVVLDNWQLCSNSGCTSIPKVGGAAVTLRGITTTVGVAQANTVIVAANADRFRQEHPSFTGLLVSQGASLANGMNPGVDTLQLRTPQGSVVDSITWGGAGTPPPPPKTKDTLQRNIQTNAWFVGPENPISNAVLSNATPQNALFVPIALKSYQNWDTGIQVQNLGTQPANVYVTYYNFQGTVLASEPLASVAVGASKTYYLPSQPLLPGNTFGSAVITATQQIGGIVNLTNYSFVGNKSATTSYNASDRVGPAVYLPLVRRDTNYTTQFVVQNAGATPTTYRITYYDQNGVVAGTFDGNLAANGSALADTSTSLQRTGIVSAVVTSPNPIAVATLGLNVTDSNAITYSGVATSTNQLYAPLLFKNRNNYNSALNIQNMGTSAATVTVSYTSDTGIALTTANETVTIQPNGFYRSEMATRIGLPDNWVGSASIVSASGQQLAVVVDQSNPTLNQVTSYNAIDSAEASGNLFAPLLMKANNGWDTGLQLQNVGTVPATVTITYYARDTFTPAATATATIQPNAPYTFYTPDAQALPAGWVGSAVVQAPIGTRLVGVVNQVNYKTGNGGDTSMTYFLTAQTP